MSAESTRGVNAALWRLLPWIRPFVPRLGAGIGLVLLTTALEVALPGLVGMAVDAVSPHGRGADAQATVCAGFLAVVVLRAGLEVVQAYLIQVTGQAITHEVRAETFQRIVRLPVAYFDAHRTGRLVTRVINDVKNLGELFTASMSVLVLDCLTIAGTVVAMWVLDWRLGAVVCAVLPPLGLAVRHFGRRQTEAYRRVRTCLSEMNAFLGESLGGMATIQRLAAEDQRARAFERVVVEHQRAAMESLRTHAMIQPITNVLNGIAVAGVLAVGGLWAIEGILTLGVLVAFLGYVRNLFQPIRDIVEKYNTFLSAGVAAERISAILLEPIEEGRVGTGRTVGAGASRLEFRGVSFRYPGRTEHAAVEVSFSVAPGRSLALVGPTGSGKSTLIRLLMRFYEPEVGEIRIGEQPLVAIDRFAWRRSVGYVPQEVYVFSGTLRQNLSLLTDGADDGRLVEVCRRTRLWEIVEPRGGLDLPLLEGGAGLSAGERQLLALTRVLVLDPPILVLDEATSHLDRNTEHRLMEALAETMAGRTTVVVAHRLATVSHCDEVVALEHGSIVARGTYEELRRPGGFLHRPDRVA